MPNAYRQNTQIRLTASFSSLAATTLSAAITSVVQTAITVASASGFPSSGNYDIVIDGERMTVVAGQGSTSWTVVRGVNQSASVHDTGAAVVAALGTAADPGAVTGKVLDPRGITTALTVVKDNTGNYHADYTTPAIAGPYGYSFTGTSPVIAQVEGTFIVLPSVTAV